MYTITRNRIDIVFDSLDEFEREAAKDYSISNGEQVHGIFSRDSTNSRVGPMQWFGTRTAEEAISKIKAGWPEMLEKLRKMMGNEERDLELVASEAKVRRRKRHRSDHGDTLDMHRVWSGELDKAWERPVREYRMEVTQRHATLFVDLSASWNIPADSLLWRAAAAMKICDLLQRAGRSVEIYVGVAGNAVPQHNVYGAIKVKDYMQPLNPERLATMVTAAFYRTYGFMLYCAQPKSVYDSYGPILGSGMPKVLEDRRDAGELVVDMRQCFSSDAAEREFKRVRDMLSKEAA